MLRLFATTLQTPTKLGEMFRVRSIAQDLLTATRGFQVSQKFVEAEIDIVVAKLVAKASKKETVVSMTPKQLEDLACRLRAILAQLRSAIVHSWTVPTRYGVLKAVIQQAELAFPPVGERAKSSPIKDKKRLTREEVWLQPPGKFGDVDGPPVLRLSSDEVAETPDDDDVVVVMSPSVSTERRSTSPMTRIACQKAFNTNSDDIVQVNETVKLFD